jgi:methyltransferase (TIGR00027 family)
VIVPLLAAIDPGAVKRTSLAFPDLPNAPFLLRSRFTEDELAAGFQRGIRQYVILGSGLDTFAYRQPEFGHEVRIFEVDSLKTKAGKVKGLSIIGLNEPPNLEYVPFDFERQSLREELARYGFDEREPAFFSCLGLSQYLTGEAIDRIIVNIGSLPNKTTIVLSFVLPNECLIGNDLLIAREGERWAALLGEPWLTYFRPEEIEARLRDSGFSEVSLLNPTEATIRYSAYETSGFQALNVEQLIWASISSPPTAS